MSNSDEVNAEKGKKSSDWIRDVLVTAGILLVLVIGVGLLMPSPGRSTNCSLQGESMNDLRQIGLGILHYSTNRPDGKFPPAYLADDEGRPMHSWRVLILRELEEEALYEAYDFEKPWDHPENLKVAQRMPVLYQSARRRQG